METVVGDISGAIQQHKNLSDVRLGECCDKIIRGVIAGVVVSQSIQTFTFRPLQNRTEQCIQFFSFGTYFSKSTVLVNILYTYCVCIVATVCTVVL